MSSSRSTRLIAATAAGALALTGLAAAAAVPAGAATAAPGAVSAQTITPTSKQLSSWGFTKKPNTSAWGNGTATITGSTLAQWQDLYITGTAPTQLKPGDTLSLKRFVPTDTKGSGYFTDLGITTTVTKKRTFTLHAQLGRVGVYGYTVSHTFGGSSPETMGVEFQVKTTKGAAPQSLLPTVTSKDLAAWGFTKKPNVKAWPGGTATLSATSAAAGADVTLKGKAPTGAKPGTVLALKRFVVTDASDGSGYFANVNAKTKVTKKGTYTLVFDLGLKGLYGYTVGYGQAGAWVGVEFQLQTT